MQVGAILVFVPGWEQISKLNENIKSRQFFKSGNDTEILQCQMPKLQMILMNIRRLSVSAVLLHGMICLHEAILYVIVVIVM